MNAFLDWLPEGGRESVARDILASDTDDKLFEVFDNLFTALLKPMKARASVQATPSPYPKRRENAEIIGSTMVGPKSREKEFREDCFLRDSSRCLVSGDMDLEKWEKVGGPDDISSCCLHAAHIIPFSFATWDNTPAARSSVEYTREAIFRCFPAVRHAGLRADEINDLSNGLSLSVNAHDAFDSFFFAFVSTGNENEYTLKLYRQCPGSVRRDARSPIVKFTQAKGAEHIPLPEPALLDCHYRVAEILHASGMGEYIDRKLRDWDDIKGAGHGHLNPDGTTNVSALLQAGLWGTVAPPIGLQAHRRPSLPKKFIIQSQRYLFRYSNKDFR